MGHFPVKPSGEMPGRITSPYKGCAAITGRDERLGSMPVFVAPSTPSTDLARRLWREADIELSAGHHEAAERLAHQAATLDGWA